MNQKPEEFRWGVTNAFLAGKSVRAIRKEFQCSSGTVLRYRHEMVKSGIPLPTCNCGREAGHKGMCKSRLAKISNHKDKPVVDIGVGHPVTVPSGAHGIVTRVGKDGMTEVDLIGGSVIRVPHKELKSYFDNPLLEIKGNSMNPATAVTELQSTRAQIIAIITAAGDKRLAGAEIYAQGNFAYPEQVYNELFQLHKKHKVLNREKAPNGNGASAVYKYWLVPGAKFPEHLEADVAEATGKNGKAVATHEFKAHDDSAITVKGDELKLGHTLPPPELLTVGDGLNIDKPITAPQANLVMFEPSSGSAKAVAAATTFSDSTTDLISKLKAERDDLLQRIRVLDKRITVLAEWLKEDIRFEAAAL